VGLLDQNGVWIPLQTYISQSTTLKLPNLKVIGHQSSIYWTQLYQAVVTVPLEGEINCQDPANLILKTELDLYIWCLQSRLTEQLKVLDKMRKLPQNWILVKLLTLIKNPQNPLVQMNHAKKLS